MMLFLWIIPDEHYQTTTGHDRLKMNGLSFKTKYSEVNYDLISIVSGYNSDSEYGYDEDWAFPDICLGQACEGLGIQFNRQLH